MAKPDLTHLAEVKDMTISGIIKDGVGEMADDDMGFEYKVGEIDGFEVKVSMEPIGNVSGTVTCVDGVDGFGFLMVYEKDHG